MPSRMTKHYALYLNPVHQTVGTQVVSIHRMAFFRIGNSPVPRISFMDGHYLGHSRSYVPGIFAIRCSHRPFQGISGIPGHHPQRL